MSSTLIIVIIVFSILMLLVLFYGSKKYKALKSKNKSKVKKEKKPKIKKDLNIKVKPSEMVDIKGSYVDTVDKFLFRKEFKLFILINRILPKGYIAFPKVSVGLILVPVGNKVLFDLIRDKYVDIVIFDEATMKPKVAVDLYDGSIGDEQLDVESPNVVNAFKIAELPLVSFRVKTEYTTNEIKDPIFKALGIDDKNIKHIAE